MRGWLAVVALGLGVSVLWPSHAPAGPAVVSAILAGAHEGQLQVEIRGSEPLSYVLIEGVEPFSVSLLLLNATFGFPTGERELPGVGLKRIRTGILERDGSLLGRLDLTFAESAPYRILKEGTRLLIRVDTAPPPQGLILGELQRESPARPGPPTIPTPRGLRAPRPLILNLLPEIVGEEVRVIVEADGPLAHKSFVLENPFTVVVDFEGARFRRLEETVEVGDALLRRIRSSQFSPTVVRVVLDLARPRPFWVEARARGAVIHLGGSARHP